MDSLGSFVRSITKIQEHPMNDSVETKQEERREQQRKPRYRNDAYVCVFSRPIEQGMTCIYICILTWLVRVVLEW